MSGKLDEVAMTSAIQAFGKAMEEDGANDTIWAPRWLEVAVRAYLDALPRRKGLFDDALAEAEAAFLDASRRAALQGDHK